MPGAYGYPASCENVISVGATDIAGARATTQLLIIWLILLHLEELLELI